MELNKSIFKGLLITNIITLLLLFGTNIGWFIYESQFQATTTEQIQTVENVETIRDITQNN